MKKSNILNNNLVNEVESQTRSKKLVAELESQIRQTSLEIKSNTGKLVTD